MCAIFEPRWGASPACLGARSRSRGRRRRRSRWGTVRSCRCPPRMRQSSGGSTARPASSPAPASAPDPPSAEPAPLTAEPSHSAAHTGLPKVSPFSGCMLAQKLDLLHRPVYPLTAHPPGTLNRCWWMMRYRGFCHPVQMQP